MRPGRRRSAERKTVIAVRVSDGAKMVLQEWANRRGETLSECLRRMIERVTGNQENAGARVAQGASPARTAERGRLMSTVHGL